MGSGYRERHAALCGRIHEHRERLERLDEELPPSSRRLARKVKHRLADLRERAEPIDNSVQALVDAERAADAYEHCLDESLGLDAELRKSVDPILPRKEVLARWVGFGMLSLAALLVTGQQTGLGDFMLRALGVKVQRVDAELSSEPLRHTAHATTPPEAPSPPHIERIKVTRSLEPSRTERRE